MSTPSKYYKAIVWHVGDDGMLGLLEFVDHQGTLGHWIDTDIRDLGSFKGSVDDVVNAIRTKCKNNYPIAIGTDNDDGFFALTSLNDDESMRAAIELACINCQLENASCDDDDATSHDGSHVCRNPVKSGS